MCVWGGVVLMLAPSGYLEMGNGNRKYGPGGLKWHVPGARYDRGGNPIRGKMRGCAKLIKDHLDQVPRVEEFII